MKNKPLKPPFKSTGGDTKKTDFGWSITSAECTEMRSKQFTEVTSDGTPGICKSTHPDTDSQWDRRLECQTVRHWLQI